MSGPIVRKYGFPNFEKIFGKREVEHGVEEPDGSNTEAEGTGLPPDLAHKPVDPTRPSSSGQMAPSTEFGSTTE